MESQNRFLGSRLRQQFLGQQPEDGDNGKRAERLSGYSWFVILLGIVLVVGIWVFISRQISGDYGRTIAEASRETMNLAVAFEERKQVYFRGVSLASIFILAVCGLLVNRHEKLRAKEAVLQAQNEELLAMEEELVRHRDNLQALVTIQTQELECTLGELRQANVKLLRQAQLLEMSHVYIMVRDKDNRIIYWNRGAEAGYGWLASEVMGLVPHSLLKTQFPMSAKENMDKLLSEGSWEGQLTYTRKDGQQVIVQSYQTLNRDAAGDPETILEINHDITAQKDMEADITRLDRLNTIGEMAASIGHEVRNPLTTVRGYLQHFSRKAGFADYGEQLTLMIEELDRANGIISEFLSLAKNKAITLSATELNKVIEWLVPLLQADALLRGKNIELDLKNIPAVLADDKEMRQCILNLVANGLDAAPKGGAVTISTAAVGDKVVLTVRDDGPGISPAIKDSLGTPFVTTKDQGAGLGLAVCYRIARRHRAAIEVETGPEGTAFHIVFSQLASAQKGKRLPD